MSGQFDGDGNGPSPFSQSMQAPPSFFGGAPPWHLWGGSTTITANFNSVNDRANTQQIVKVSYKRPETWHWLFVARLISGPPGPFPGPGNSQVSIVFNLTCGVGRSVVQLFSFEAFDMRWAAAVPVGETLFSVQVLARNRIDTSDPTLIQPNVINQIVASDIQLDATVTNVFGPEPAVVEVSAFFSPKTHVRPDWFVDGPPDARFAGGEVAGR